MGFELNFPIRSNTVVENNILGCDISLRGNIDLRKWYLSLEKYVEQSRDWTCGKQWS